MTSLLSVRGVKTYYGKIAALKGVDIDVNDGEIVTLIGSNGAGKSTLMMTICGPTRPRAGSRHLRAVPTVVGWPEPLQHAPCSRSPSARASWSVSCRGATAVPR